MRKTIYKPEYRLLVETLRNMRGERQITQTELARRLGWTQQRLSFVESGARRLDVLEYLQLAGELGLKDEEAVNLALTCLRSGVKKKRNRG